MLDTVRSFRGGGPLHLPRSEVERKGVWLKQGKVAETQLDLTPYPSSYPGSPRGSGWGGLRILMDVLNHFYV